MQAGITHNNRQEPEMKVKALVTAAIGAALMSSVASAAELRLSHQWSTKDVRHKVAEIVANHVKDANVDLEIKIFPSKSLFKPKEQYKPLSRGQLDMTVLPLSYAGGQQPSYNLTLMPGLVKDKCLSSPSDVKGIQMRAAGKSFNQLLAGAGASIASMASSEIYNAMQTGVLDGANTSSSSFVSYRIYEQVKCYTPAAEQALWFMYQPLLMNKSTFDGLNDAQKQALREGAKKAEEFYLTEAKKQDADSVRVFREAGVQIKEMTKDEFQAWQNLAKETSYKQFVADYPEGQRFLDLALAVE
jgi:TRAP-type C4-dicarboxylate transport system substrate-binding protein